ILRRAFFEADAGAEVPDVSHAMDRNGFSDRGAAVCRYLKFETVFTKPFLGAEHIRARHGEAQGCASHDSSYVGLLHGVLLIPEPLVARAGADPCCQTRPQRFRMLGCDLDQIAD